jgi:hypothetical protein
LPAPSDVAGFLLARLDVSAAMPCCGSHAEDLDIKPADVESGQDTRPRSCSAETGSRSNVMNHKPFTYGLYQ